MKSAAPSGAPSMQANPVPHPYSGGLVSQPMRKHGNLFHRATAFVLADSHQEYVVHSMLRNVLRALIVIAVFGAVIGLTVAKYVTDNDLRGSTTTVRTEDVSKLSGTQIELAQCPCQNDTLLWSDFVTYTGALSIDSTTQLCNEALVPELKTTQQPTENSTDEERDTYLGYQEKLIANFETHAVCSLSLNQVFQVLDPNLPHMLGRSDDFYNTELLSKRQVQERVATFISGKMMMRTEEFGAQLLLQGTFIRRLETRYNSSIGNFININTPAGAAGAQAAQLALRLAYNVTVDTLIAMTEKAADQKYIGGLLGTVFDNVTLDYAAYQDACQPYYCDYTRSKTAWSRITEFLGLLGGLYTTLLGVGFLAWFLVDLALPGDHGKFMV